MQGGEGQIVGPIARAYGWGLLAALRSTFTLAPVRSSMMLPAPGRDCRTAQVGEHMAIGADQGADGQADEREAQPQIRRRRFQFLAIYPGQYRASRLRRERRELDQDLRPGPQ